MEPLPTVDLQLVAIVAAVAALAAGLFFAWRWDQRRRMRAVRSFAVTSCGFDYLRDVLVPDGQGSALHVDFLLLTARGVIVIDLRDIAGNIFGGDQMSAWTVMHRAQRYTFVNPQTGLYDRIAAVRALAQGLPVDGRIVFTARGRFPKGLPRHTLMLDSLPSEFPVADRETMRSLLERWMPAWSAIKKSVAPSRLAAPKAAI
ncbi:MAG TPA: nuclease-related domain-containing protein [Steroidobacteraceae bacterium]|nr:nuclease-related domain-containing protein [Steroidobacteraceae bacterium]